MLDFPIMEEQTINAVAVAAIIQQTATEFPKASLQAVCRQVLKERTDIDLKQIADALYVLAYDAREKDGKPEEILKIAKLFDTIANDPNASIYREKLIAATNLRI